MSHHEYEHGQLLLPTAAFPKLRRLVCEGHNAWQLHCLEKAQLAHDRVSAAIKGKRLPDVAQAVDDALNALATQETHQGYQGLYPARRSRSPVMGEEGVWLIRTALLKTDPAQPARRPVLRRPLKKDFPTVPLTHGTFVHGETSLQFNAATRTVHWSVPENNRAVERAWESPLGQVFSQGLSQVEWTRGSGGKFLYNDEYNRDNGRDVEGGGATQVSRRFGPLGNDERLSRTVTARTVPGPGRRF